jgi:acyl-CoA reductase-like NAD-dependent aldehyde dehydrogenase
MSSFYDYVNSDNKETYDMAYQTVNPANNQLIKQYAAHSDADVEAALQKADALYHSRVGEGDIDQRLPVLHRLADLIQDEPIWRNWVNRGRSRRS